MVNKSLTMKKNNYKKDILKKIFLKKIRICVIGLGYVGLPLSLLLSKKNDVVGIDTADVVGKDESTRNNCNVDSGKA